MTVRDSLRAAAERLDRRLVPQPVVRRTEVEKAPQRPALVARPPVSPWVDRMGEKLFPGGVK